MKRKQSFITALLLLVLTAFGWSFPARAQGAGEVNWGELSDATLLSDLSITSQYKEALSGGTWKNLTNNLAGAKWIGSYKNDRFQMSIGTFNLKGKGPYHTYLVSPALSLGAIKGKKLSFEFTNSMGKGTISPLKVLLVKKTGEVIKEVTTVQGAVDKNMSTLTAHTAVIPNDIDGAGFLAFYATGDYDNRAAYMVKNIEITAGGAASEPSIVANPNKLDFYDVPINTSSDAKTINVLAKNYTGAITITKEGDVANDFVVNPLSLMDAGGAVTVQFAPKTVGDKSVTLVFTAGAKKAQVTLVGKGTNSSGGAPSLTADPTELKFALTQLGATSQPQTATITIYGFMGTPTCEITGVAKSDFLIQGTSGNLSSSGGAVSVVFKPTMAGERKAALKVSAGTEAIEVLLRGEGGTEGAGGSTPVESAFEALKDNFFYEFDANDKPLRWETKGTITKLQGSDRYNSSSQFGVGIATAAGETGYIKQVVVLDKAGEAGNKVIKEGNELEGLIHYQTVESTLESGPFRLACQWLDAEGREITTDTEKGLLNNDKLFFGRAKAYGEFKFHTVCPKGAVKFVFSLEVAPESKVFVDDFGLTCLDKSGMMKPFATILPQYRTIYGKIGETKEYPIAVQTKHFNASIIPNFSGTDASNVLKLKDATTLGKDQTLATYLQVTPTAKGAFYMDKAGAYSVALKGGDDTAQGTLALTAFFIDPKTPPTMKLKTPTEAVAMTAAPGKTQEQTFTFDISGVITDVKLAIKQKENGAFRINKGLFWYSSATGKLYDGPVIVTFAPKVEGEYEATLTLSSPMAQDLVINLKGSSKKPDGNVIVEKFTADNPKDARFTGDAWKGYHKFDQGYWYLDGTWNKESDITLKNQGVLYYDEVLPTGIESLSVQPSTAADQLTLEYSIDGGGHWIASDKKAVAGTFSLGTKRPTLVRFINTGVETSLNEVALAPNKENERQTFKGIEEAMLLKVDKAPLALLNETFNGYRHTRILSIPGWQNLMLLAERPFYGFQQKNATQDVVENDVAQICFLAYGKVDDRPHHTWLLSPTLSYKQAKSKVLTFRMQYRNPIENGQEKFGLYVITEKEGVAQSTYVDLTKFVPMGVQVEPNIWFDYYIDLSKVEGLVIDDLFHVGFSFSSPVGGNKTSLNIMIDDVTFGRDDLPSITVDKDLLAFEFYPGQKAEPQAFNVKTTNANSPVTLSLVPSRLKSTFLMAKTQLPKEGGAVAVGFKSDSKKDVAGMLLVQTRGAESKVVRLFGKNLTAIEDIATEAPVTVYPTTAHDVLHVKGHYQSYSLFTLSGELIASGDATNSIYIGSLPSGRYLVRLYVEGVGYKPFVVEKQ